MSFSTMYSINCGYIESKPYWFVNKDGENVQYNDNVNSYLPLIPSITDRTIGLAKSIYRSIVEWSLLKIPSG